MQIGEHVSIINKRLELTSKGEGCFEKGEVKHKRQKRNLKEQQRKHFKLLVKEIIKERYKKHVSFDKNP